MRRALALPARIDDLRRAAAAPITVTVGADRLVRADGVAVTGLRCRALDVTTLDDGARAALVAGLERLARTLDAPLTMLVTVRPWTVDTVCPEVERRHEEALLAADPAFLRTVCICCVEPDATGAPRARDRAAALLAAAGVEPAPLPGQELAALLAEAVGVDGGDGAGVVVEGPWQETVSGVVHGGLVRQAAVVTALPGTAVAPGWLAPVLRVRCACEIAVHLEPVTDAVALRRLGRRLRALRAEQLVDLDRDGAGDAGADHGVDAATDLRDRLVRNEGRPLHLRVTAVARGADAASCARGAALIAAAFEATLARAASVHLDHRAATAASLPLCLPGRAPAKLVDSAGAATVAPFVEGRCDDPGGTLLGRVTTSGTPVRLAVHDSRRHVNANIAVLAASGRGKSYVLGSLVLGAAARGVGAVLVDPEGEYERVVRAVQGTWIELRAGGTGAINPFEVGDPASDDPVAPVVALVETLATGGVDDAERAAVDAAARAALEAADPGPPLLGHLLPELRRTAPRVARLLERSCEGPAGALLNRPSTLSREQLGDGVVAFSLRDLRDELVPAVTLLLAEWLWTVVRRDRRRRHLVFDEVGLLCAHPPLRRLISQLARRCRKYGASLVVATQNAGDLLGDEESRVIATNAATVLLGGHHGAETALMAAAYALTPEQRRWLEGAPRGEFLLLTGSGRLPVRIEVPQEWHGILSAPAVAAV